MSECSIAQCGVVFIGDVSHTVYLKCMNKIKTDDVRWLSPHNEVIHWLASESNSIDIWKPDYIVFLLTDESMKLELLPMIHKHYPDSFIIICCLDKKSHEEFLMHEKSDDCFYFWAFDLDQAIKLVRDRAKPFVSDAMLEV